MPQPLVNPPQLHRKTRLGGGGGGGGPRTLSGRGSVGKTTDPAATKRLRRLVAAIVAFLLAAVALGPFLVVALHGPDPMPHSGGGAGDAPILRRGTAGAGDLELDDDDDVNQDQQPPPRIREQLQGLPGAGAGAPAMQNGRAQKQQQQQREDVDPALQDISYGTRPPLGRHDFASSPGCQFTPADPSKRCTLYYPEVELSDHLERDEAFVLAQRLQGRLRMTGGGAQNAAAGGNGDDGMNQPRVVGNIADVPPGADADYGVLTRHGYKGGLPGGAVNQDRMVIVAPYRIMNPDAAAGGGDDDAERNNFLMAIFDGHGDRGHATSHKIILDFPVLLAEELTSRGVVRGDASAPGDVDKAKEAFDATYKELNRRVESISGAGCTASAVLRLGNKMFVANAGDSTSLIVTRDPSRSGAASIAIAYRNREDKPHLPDERARIQAMGGQIMIPPEHMQPPPGSDQPRLSSRVLAILDNGMQLALAMSRSLGDPEANLVGVIPDPIVDVIDVEDVRRGGGGGNGGGDQVLDVFVVVASDGLFDHVREEEVVEAVAGSLYDGGGGAGGGGTKKGPRLLEMIEDLIMKSSRHWISQGNMAYRDDISLAVGRVK